jgi:hypothetical protein
MTPKIPLYLAACLALAASRAAHAAPVAPSSTDEARAAIRRSSPVACPQGPSAQQPSSTDDARALAAATIDAAPGAPSGRAPDTVSSTDDARTAAAAVLDDRPALHACAQQAPDHEA